MRIQVAQLYEQARDSISWLVPQYVPHDYVHSYWTYVLKLYNNDEFTWYDFRNKYRDLGGDGIYAAWQLTHLEPAFRGQQFNIEQQQVYDKGLCPVAEAVQPYLLQFKTNYLSLDEAKVQADVLAKTIAYFGH